VSGIVAVVTVQGLLSLPGMIGAASLSHRIAGFSKRDDGSIQRLIPDEQIVGVVRGDGEDADVRVRERGRQPRSASICGGTTSWSHTTDTSSGVRVTEQNSADAVHGGTGSPDPRRQMQYRPGFTNNASLSESAIALLYELTRDRA
jgi:hypothetical protein